MCFDGFGCFEVGNNFTHPLGLPSSPDYIGASTWLYSRGRYETNPKQIDFRTVSSLEDMRELRANKPLFILIHGYRRSRKHIWISETIIALLAKADCNIITVDWGKTHSFFYPWTAAYDTALVGKLLALLVHSLMNRFPKAISASSIHAIGQSFGAHVASFFAKHFKNDTGLLVGRITGLDPAAPYFEGHNVHLSNTDAEFVDVIHTSAGKNHYSLRNGDLGFRSPIGHVDFYPNGGTRVQPGCEYKIRPCSHSMAYRFFLASINRSELYQSYLCEEGFEAALQKRCKNFGGHGRMGFYSRDTTGRGVQYLTATVPPEIEKRFNK
ncbi:pancreatic triacylglycerol lipase isoform X2 [Ixodes scapularis]|uniref:pancreatic triacylglycerol lipase isoform X2 n=1 Tax=Ixodes scapularis TaxID=6945 RepID=UPI001A9D605A|nr:pancreatic triacylglycerol lipase isoform X2 [Ixodes scapularis]